ncbi:hypothetical protein [Sphingosinicella microcystinivorans]|uniref:hypothetical protein n=1 Tax=Sphingosinicella microcystinivorans TaxID=335406 RepID=UPI0022F3BF5E|nr:hypothetical protein [Sphingosinicella microcystinivorans]WBX86040.1 hypothetical protein PE061_09065 [Sphingosinicella microcystinivorans]
MKDQTAFYEERIAEAQRAIAEAVLMNVRKQAILARDRWIELAGQHTRNLLEGEKVRAAKLARDAERELAAAGK